MRPVDSARDNELPDVHIEASDCQATPFYYLTDEEKEEVLRWRNDPDVRKVMYNDRMLELEEHLRFIEVRKNDQRNSYWMIKQKSDGAKLGVAYLNRIDRTNRNAFMGMYANPDSPVKNTGKLLLDTLRHIAYDVLGLHTIKLELLSVNHDAIAYYTDNGFIEEGRLKEFVVRDGVFHDVVIFGDFSGK